MIVLSPGLIIAAGPSTGPNNPIIGWHNLVTLGGVTADSADPNFPVSNVANAATYLKWKSASGDPQSLEFAISAESEIDYVGIARHNFGSGTIGFQIETDVGEDTVELIPEAFPAGDGAIIARFAPRTATNIRINLNPTGSTMPEAAVIHVGKLTVLERRIYVGHTPLPMAREKNVVTGISEQGEYLGSIENGRGLANDVSLQNMTPAWYREHLDPIIAASPSPFFFGWRPQKYPAEAGYAWITNKPKVKNQRSNGMMQVDLQLGAIA